MFTDPYSFMSPNSSLPLLPFESTLFFLSLESKDNLRENDIINAKYKIKQNQTYQYRTK